MQNVTTKLIIERPNQERLCPIYVRVTIDRKKKLFHTGEKIPKKYWNAKQSNVRLSSEFPEAKAIKYRIEKAQTDLMEAVRKLELSGTPISFESINEIIQGGKPILFDTFARELIERQLRLKQIKPATFAHNRKVINWVKKLDKKILLSKITPRWIKKFKGFLIKEGLRDTSVGTYLLGLRKIISAALAEGYIQSQPFDKVKIERGKYRSREFLSLDELEGLFTDFISGNILEKPILSPLDWEPIERELLHGVIHRFLISCYSGLRWGDIYTLKWEEISKTQITKRTGKTGRIVRIPLHPKLKRLIEIVPKESEFLFDQREANNSMENKILRAVLKSSGISKYITFHCGRHTFATTALTLGIDITVISSILGHSAITTTQLYAKLVDKRLEEEMEKFGALEEEPERRDGPGFRIVS